MDNSPTSLFESYQQDFTSITQSISQKLNEDLKGEARKASLRRVEIELDEAEEVLSQMEVEIHSMPQSLKAQYQARLKSSKSSLTTLKKQSKDFHSALQRSLLLSTAPGGAYSDDAEGGGDRERLLTGHAILENGTRRLDESRRIALETEEQGAEILRSLRGQREQIENSRDMLQTADRSIDRASGTLKKMIRRMYQQRFITAAIIAVLVILIALILYFKLR
ncbi:vesicle transport v-snare protein vti1 [Sistotremastrum suecicum HHB10207 ss-3]|uniref:Vesicle transport v-snare protein vti1 n=1 Tax=Sistotremastrum suecicum HHB10207 ss-3 TaxID=1314776 RepID=A0A166F9Y6_9AGAM|nr:vesicle transport v-snare protein vti1 [Sistotremastrum suecicum HHB10207 ss-3]